METELITGVVAGIISGAVVLVGSVLINRYIIRRWKKKIIKEDLIKYFNDITNQDDSEIWIEEMRQFIRQKNELIKFEFRNYLMSELQIIEQSLDRGKLPNTEIERTVENIRITKI